MHNCLLCDKIFLSNSKLERHKNRKNPCNKPKELYNCEICKADFKFKYDLERHEKTNKHITNYNVHIENLNLNVNTYVLGTFNIFRETCINTINDDNMKQFLNDDNILIDALKFIKDNNNEFDIDYLGGDSTYIISIFKYFIKLFAKINFNLAYTKNHNCSIYSFSKLDNNYIEYHLLEIDHVNNEYKVDIAEYKDFINEFTNLMIKINNKIKNEDFALFLKYIEKNKNMLYSYNTKLIIEDNLYNSYKKFKKAKDNISEDEKRFLKERTEVRANSLRNMLCRN